MFAWAAQMLARFPVPCLGNEKLYSLVDADIKQKDYRTFSSVA